MATKKKKKPRRPKTVYQVKVELMESGPPIWRRLLVPGEATLASFHEILQVAMGWTNSHLHQFEIHGCDYSDPEFELEDAEDEGEYTLSQIAPQVPDRFIYMYDFGDGWKHVVRVEKILPVVEGQRYPACVGGAMACPPEDCGGIGGYENFLEAIRDPAHEEHDSMLEWIGGAFDPQDFNPDLVSKDLELVEW
ncbi:MAG TPA: plasmid pRiA4b ORF-3 family protein [Terriglobia bacterium]|nr:plasmid pRiA4b ORF-3 family protein [Terriglobia bacterium]